ncbi:MAG: lanthionine synthetase LanC family protein [Planctomycetota bacterium]
MLTVLFCLALGGEGSRYLEVALDTARWLESAAIKTPNGLAWPADPRDPTSVQASLYTGSCGVILFLLELHHATEQAHALEQARAGADQLIAGLQEPAAVHDLGLYTGLAGVAFTLEQVAAATQAECYRVGAERARAALRASARSVDGGSDWNDTSDVISGTAGIGLALLAANDAADVALATRAGKRLLALAIADGANRKWRMDPTFERLMPNFSHGTAGIAYYLACLHAATHAGEFLDGAIAGAHYLQAVARTEGDQCLILHHEPQEDGKNLFYLGWCHGPVGTARLFQKLFQITGSAEWLSWVTRCANAILMSGIPDQLTPGFWNNVGQCCGSAGIAEFFLELHRLTREPRYLAFAKRLTEQLLAKATTDAAGTRWVQAEHRLKPDLLVAQTGYMQGAAGIGMWLLHLDEFERGTVPRIRLPDSPW